MVSLVSVKLVVVVARLITEESLVVIVIVRFEVPGVVFVGFNSRTRSVSFPSGITSSMIRTVKVLVVTPGAKLKMPLVA